MMSNLKAARKGFVPGSTTYKCTLCGKLTRSTGRGDNENLKQCVDCYDKAGDENAVTDNLMTVEEFKAKWNCEPFA